MAQEKAACAQVREAIESTGMFVPGSVEVRMVEPDSIRYSGELKGTTRKIRIESGAWKLKLATPEATPQEGE